MVRPEIADLDALNVHFRLPGWTTGIRWVPLCTPQSLERMFCTSRSQRQAKARRAKARLELSEALNNERDARRGTTCGKPSRVEDRYVVLNVALLT